MPKRILQGTVVSDKNEKTVVVKVERRFTHPVMKKTVRQTKKYKAHDESNAHKVGDMAELWRDIIARRHRVHPGIEADLQGQALDRHHRAAGAVTKFGKPGRGETLPKNEEGDLS